MKVLLINGSPHPKGCTARALQEVSDTLEKNGIETETVWIGTGAVHGCIACMSCRKTGKCVFNDDSVNAAAEKFREADGLVIGAPVHFGSANGSMISYLDRLFYSSGFDKRMKIGASVVTCRRGGNSSTFDELNKYFTIAQMPIASSSYWNMVYGYTAEDVEKDLEGLETMRVIGRNMAFLIKAVTAEKEKKGLPEAEEHHKTNFMDGK